MWESVLIVDDHELFGETLKIALKAEGIDAHHVKPARFTDVLKFAEAIPSGLIVLDLDLGTTEDGEVMHGSDIVSALRRGGWKVLIVSGRQDQPGIAAAIAAGAIGLVPKTRSFEDLLGTVVRAAAGEQVMSELEYQAWLSRDREHRVRKLELRRRLDRLSPREREVLELLNKGYRAVAIAERAVVSMATVRTQIRSILSKLEVNSQLEAVVLLRQESE